MAAHRDNVKALLAAAPPGPPGVQKVRREAAGGRCRGMASADRLARLRVVRGTCEVLHALSQEAERAERQRYAAELQAQIQSKQERRQRERQDSLRQSRQLLELRQGAAGPGLLVNGGGPGLAGRGEGGDADGFGTAVLMQAALLLYTSPISIWVNIAKAIARCYCLQVGGSPTKPPPTRGPTAASPARVPLDNAWPAADPDAGWDAPPGYLPSRGSPPPQYLASSGQVPQEAAPLPAWAAGPGPLQPGSQHPPAAAGFDGPGSGTGPLAGACQLSPPTAGYQGAQPALGYEGAGACSDFAGERQWALSAGHLPVPGAGRLLGGGPAAGAWELRGGRGSSTASAGWGPQPVGFGDLGPALAWPVLPGGSSSGMPGPEPSRHAHWAEDGHQHCSDLWPAAPPAHWAAARQPSLLPLMAAQVPTSLDARQRAASEPQAHQQQRRQQQHYLPLGEGMHGHGDDPFVGGLAAAPRLAPPSTPGRAEQWGATLPGKLAAFGAGEVLVPSAGALHCLQSLAAAVPRLLTQGCTLRSLPLCARLIHAQTLMPLTHCCLLQAQGHAF